MSEIGHGVDLNLIARFILTECDKVYLRLRRHWRFSDAVAEAAVDEVVLVAVKAVQSGKAETLSNLAGWIWKVALTAARRHAKHESRYASADVTNFVFCWPERGEDANPVMIALWEAFKKLPDDEQMAVRLHVLDEKSIAKVAKEMGLCVGSVRYRLAKARRTLAVSLGFLRPLLMDHELVDLL